MQKKKRDMEGKDWSFCVAFDRLGFGFAGNVYMACSLAK